MPPKTQSSNRSTATVSDCFEAGFALSRNPSPSTEGSAELLSGMIAGRFLIAEFMGKGGMGELYPAHERQAQTHRGAEAPGTARNSGPIWAGTRKLLCRVAPVPFLRGGHW